MINFMYLVLTAMLALNVSSEILNAFKVVNASIVLSNKMISDKNEATYVSFGEMARDPRTMAKAAIWKPKAEEIRKLSLEMYNYIESLQMELKKQSRLKIIEGGETFVLDNLDAPTRLMEKKGKGKELYDKLAAYRKDVTEVFNAEEFTDPVLYDQVKEDIEALKKTIPIDLTVPVGMYGKKYSADAKGWTTGNFNMTPTIAAVTILSKLQNDVKNAEAQMVDYCHRQIGAVKLVYNNFQAFAQANTTYAMPGQEIEITAGVGAFSDAAKPDIYIAGQKTQLTKEGTAVWKTIAGSEGTKTVDVLIEYSKPDGTKNTIPKTIIYEVASPPGVAVSPNKMNVLYMGVDNPLTITAGVGSEKVNATFTGGEIRRAGGNQWIAIPRIQGEQKVNVIIEGKSTSVLFRVKRLPDPYAYVSGKRGGSIPANELKAQGGIIARLESDFEAPFRVISYKVGAFGGNYKLYQQQLNAGNKWNGAASDLIDGAGPGTAVFFDDIRVIGPDGIQRELPQMSFNLK
jgi:gliding motility-associated protein GldM